MIDVKFSESISETLEILNYMNKSYTERLPAKFLKFLQDNQSASYIPHFDYTKKLAVSKETQKLLGIMNLLYWSDDKQKLKYLQTLSNNQKKFEAELREKYNPDNLFASPKITPTESADIHTENNQLIEYKESIFKKVLNKIKLFLKIK